MKCLWQGWVVSIVSFIICCSVTPVQLRRCFFFFEAVNQISRLLVERYTIFGGSFNIKGTAYAIGHEKREMNNMAFDFKKEYKEFYMPKDKPEIVTVPKANYIAVRGTGNPNDEDGEYKLAVGVLYAIAYTLKMSHKTDYKMQGFFEYVVPPLEGFWWQEGIEGIDYSDKSTFCWVSVIRLPDFVTEKDFAWAVQTATQKKKIDCSKAEFLTIDEGLCVQIMHHGPFDDEPETVAIMDAYLEEQGYINDFSDKRLHHEIYLSDARKVAPERWRTVIRHPIKKKCV